jgi:hypothetical protein
LLLNLSDNYQKQAQNNPYFTRWIKVDRVGFEPTTSAAAAAAQLLFITSYPKGQHLWKENFPAQIPHAPLSLRLRNSSSSALVDVLLNLVSGWKNCTYGCQAKSVH